MNTYQLAIEILEDAFAAVSRGWAQKVFAKDENGYMVSPDDSRATSYCLAGGIHCGFYKALEKHKNVLAEDEIDKAFQLCFKIVKEKMPIGDSIVDFNDCSVTTQTDVLQVLTDAKTSLENTNIAAPNVVES